MEAGQRQHSAGSPQAHKTQQPRTRELEATAHNVSRKSPAKVRSHTVNSSVRKFWNVFCSLYTFQSRLSLRAQSTRRAMRIRAGSWRLVEKVSSQTNGKMFVKTKTKDSKSTHHFDSPDMCNTNTFLCFHYLLFSPLLPCAEPCRR